MNDIATLETQEIKNQSEVSKPMYLNRNFTSLAEVNKPRKAVFGSIEVIEDLNTDFLTSSEKKIYRDGFNIFEHLVNSTNDNITRLVLIHPDMSSGIVGIQPLVSLTTKEASLLSQSFQTANIDFNQDFSLLETKGDNWTLNHLINHNAAENVLRTYQKKLGINLPEKKLQKDELLSSITNLLNDIDIKRAHLAHGLLSGFPLNDCLIWTNKNYQFLKEVKNRPHFIKVEHQALKLNYHRFDDMDIDKYKSMDSRSEFLPDVRKVKNQLLGGKFVEGFGLRWVAPFPLQKSTINHCQRLLQIDREIGLLPFIHKHRATFRSDDAIHAIKIQNKLFASGRKVTGGILVGIHALFDTAKKTLGRVR